jgi:pimeloyl-ACP methyl ester carboxylesterase
MNDHADREVAILVHGLWMNGWCMRPLAWRLARAGFDVRCFSYVTVGATLHENAERLNGYLQATPHRTVHLVGHSLGGIVMRALFHYFPAQAPGRWVTLGSPHHGSLTAQRLASFRFGRAILGKSIREVIQGAPSAWPLPAREIGTLSGTRPVGLGRCVGRLPGPNDGTVTVDESSLAQAVDRLLLPVSHTGMILSTAVADAVARFLRRGRFA